ncbi:GntR family transcriptional regulator [Sphingomonas sp.]|jgi:DNA-binding GntR family transcriptional regulator|uniref:GntR family transcriptional regulator n=1 Tax=Sphingomonas sp. TaxID=28214 RepID=UPI002EDA636D
MPDSVDPSSATERAYGRLRRMIVTGEIAPAQRLKVETLKQLLDTGATPIREALSLLTSDQLVERVDQRGFRSAPATKARFIEILTLRCTLESLALTRAIASGTAEWDERLVLALHRTTRAPRTLFEESEVHHKAFHMTLLDACGMPMLLRLCGQLYDLNIRYRYLAGTAVDYGRRDIAREHGDVVAAVLDRDAPLAAERLVSHYQRTGQYLADKLA